ncbi:MAG: hypothetical protein KY467_18150 [Gemmatimonadetes bacterium]|nr:hypothetical protein [Gemmatimonadota bacterium]
MTRRRRGSARVVVAWTLIWFGTILAVNPRPSIAVLGATLWGVGIAPQFVIVGRWFMDSPPPAGPVRDAEPRQLPARV